MTQLLVLREYLQQFYQKKSSVINPVFRFVISFIVFFSINQVIGYHPALNHWYVECILALAGVLMSGEMLLFFVAVFVVVHIFYVSHILAVAVGILLAIIYFAYLKFIPEHAYYIIAFPIAFSLNIACGLPVLMGLLLGPVAIFPTVCGVGIYYLLRTITSVMSTSADASLNLYQAVIQQFLGNEEMYAMMAVFSLITILVYLIRRQEKDFAFEMAILAGGVANMVLILVINYIFNVDINMLLFLLGSIVSLLLVWVIQFMRIPLNYAGVENLQFEDDEYYYYVRAVPKMNIAMKDKSIKRFNVRNVANNNKQQEKEKNEEIEL